MNAWGLWGHGGSKRGLSDHGQLGACLSDLRAHHRVRDAILHWLAQGGLGLQHRLDLEVAVLVRKPQRSLLRALEDRTKGFFNSKQIHRDDVYCYSLKHRPLRCSISVWNISHPPHRSYHRGNMFQRLAGIQLNLLPASCFLLHCSCCCCCCCCLGAVAGFAAARWINYLTYRELASVSSPFASVRKC